MTNNKVYTTGGEKDLTGKLPVHLVTEQMIAGIAEGLNCGIKKGYEKHNWKKGLPICEAHLAAAMRHMGKYMSGADINVEIAKDGTEVHTHHLDNALTHLAMAVHQIKSGRTDLDDRGLKEVKVEENILIESIHRYQHDWGFDIEVEAAALSRAQALRDQFKDRNHE